MANERLIFDILARDGASPSLKKVGDAALEASGSLKDLSSKLKDVNGRTAAARVKLDGDKEAQHELDVTDAKLARLGKMVANPNIGLDGIARARADISGLDLALDKIGHKDETAKVKIKVDSSALSKLAGNAPGFSAAGTALALSPALIPLASGIAAGIGAVGISFGAAAVGAGAFGLLAKSALTQAGTAASAVETAQNRYNAAIASGTKRSTAYAAEQRAISLAYAEMSPRQIALSKQVGNLQNAWQGVQKSLTPVISGALVPWLHAATDAMKLIKPFITPVAAVFQNFGQTLKAYFSDPAVVKHLQGMAAAFGQFAALQLNNLGRFIGDIALGFYHLGKDLAGSGANLSSAGVWLQNMGAGFLSWSKSAKARAEVQGFMHYLHQEGPVVGGILRDLGKILPGIFAGATTAGTLELQAISGFLGLIAKLPQGWAKPLTEAAGAMLLLSKTGVVSVGLKLAGTKAAAKVISALAGAPLALPLVLTIGAVEGLNQIKDKTGGGTLVLPKAGDLGINGQWSKDINHWLNIGLDNVRHGVAIAFDWVRHFVAHDWDKTWGDAASRLVRGGHDVESKLDGLRHSIAGTFDGIRHDIAAAWDAIWNGTVARVRNGISAVVGWFKGLPGRVTGALFGLGHSLYAIGHAAVSELWSGFRSVSGAIIGWIKGFGSSIINGLKNLFHIHSPSAVFHGIGVNLMQGLLGGLKAGHGKVGSFLQGSVAKSLMGGVQGAFTHSASVAQAYARSLMSMYGWSSSQMSSLVPLWNQESGWNAYAVNPSSGAYGIPQSLGHGHPYNLGDYKNQIIWGLNYIRGRYGSPAAAEAHELRSGWYDNGGWLMPGLTMAMNATGKPERILPPGHSGTAPIVLQVRTGHGATDLDRAIVSIIQKFVIVSGGGDVQAALGQKA